MPNRILKESVCTSPNVERLSWFEEVVFYRLLVQCDDYGRMDARPSLLKSRLFPLKETLESTAVESALDALEAVGLIARYEVEGLPYLELVTWFCHQKLRSVRLKYPAPPWNKLLQTGNKLLQDENSLQQDVTNGVPESES